MIEYHKPYRLYHAYIVHVLKKGRLFMTASEIHWILFPFQSNKQIPERRLLGQCKTKERLAELLNDGYIVLLSEDEYGKTYALTQKAKDLLSSPAGA